MSLLPDSATFHERVQEVYVALRARGVSLSPSDVELVEVWADTGAPFEVVARGIRKAAEAALWDAAEGEGHLRSLRATRRTVDAEIKKYLARTTGRTEPGASPAEPFLLARHRRLRSLLKRLGLAHPPLAPPLERLRDHLRVPLDFDSATRQEELVSVVLLHALPFELRLRLLRDARRLVHNTEASSVATRRESLRFHRAALVRRELSLPSFW